jgi:hypothetical protein
MTLRAVASAPLTARVVRVAAAVTLTAAGTTASCEASSGTSASATSSVSVSDGRTTVHAESSAEASSGPDESGSRSRYLFMLKLAWPTDVDRPSDDALVGMGRSACAARARGVTDAQWHGAGAQSRTVYHSAAAFLC